jgi:hypothetical protein
VVLSASIIGKQLAVKEDAMVGKLLEYFEIL